MRIQRIHIQGFGCLRDVEYQVAPGLHVFHGPNEVGKSTLQRAILALLYNFYDSDRGRATQAENAARERDIPWQGGPYAAELEYELQDGKRFRVHRDFNSPEVPTQVWDLVTGRDVTHEFGRGRHGTVPFMLRHLGMTRRVFKACAFVSHGELFTAFDGREAVTSAQEIGETIVRLADTAGRDVSAKMAQERLKKAFDDRVGSDKSRAKPLAIARNKLRQAKEELDKIDAAQCEVANYAAQLEELKTEKAQVEADFIRSRYLHLQAEKRTLKNTLDQLEGLDEEAARQAEKERANAHRASFPAEERDEVQRQWTKVQVQRQDLEQAQPGIEEARTRVQQLKAEIADLDLEEQKTAYLRTFPAEREALVEERATVWRQARAVEDAARARLEEAQAQAEPVGDEFARLDADVGWMTDEDVQRLVEGLSAGRSPLSTLLRAAGRALSRAWALVLAAVRWLVGRLLRRRTEAAGTVEESPAPAPRAPRLPSGDPAKLMQRRQRYLELAPTIKACRDAQNALAEAEGKVAAAATALREALGDAVDGTTDLEAACALFRQRLGQRRQLEAGIAKRNSLEQQISDLTQAIAKYDENRLALAGLEAALKGRLEVVLGRSAPLEDLVAGFEEGCKGKEAWAEARRELAEIQKRRDILLAGRSPQEIRGALDDAEEQLKRMEATDPALAGAASATTAQQLQKEVDDLRKRREDLNQQISGLTATIDTQMKRLRSRSGVEEEIACLDREVANLEEFGKALQIAQEAIGQAMKEAHRDFAPHIGQFLGSGLARVTGDRYQRAFLDPSTLLVTVEVPEDGHPKTVDQLSRGTQAAAYLLLRAGLAQHMSSLREPVPLILDDPFVDLDDIRLENFLDLLVDLSQEMQILLFTKDSDTREWFDRNCLDRGRYGISYLGRASLGLPAA